jgi:signal transduction histidine kinase
MDGVGALEVPALAARVRAAVDRVRPTDIPPDKWIWTSVWHEGEEILVATAVECDARSVPWALVGVTFTRRPLDASTVRSTLTYTPLLPSNFQGVDWLSARLLAPPAAGVPARAARASLDVRHNRLVDVQVATADGVVLHASRPGLTAAAFASAYAAEYVRAGERLVVRVAFPPARAARLVAAAVPAGPERWLLAAVTGLAGLMSIAGAFGIWQQHRLVESRRNFVAAVSHELRTPLTQLSVLSETLLLGGAESPEQERRWLAAMQRECRRLAVTVENVLLHARADRHTALIGPTPADLAAVVRDVVEQVRAVRAPYPSTLTLDVPPTCAAEVDVGAMRHVLHNLLDNALKHGGQRPHVRVALREVRHTGHVVLTVDDRGPGVPPEDRRRIWEPFERLGNRGGATGGAGLGLSVVRDLVRAHRGTVHVEDAPGGGARFVVVLPRLAAPRGAASGGVVVPRAPSRRDRHGAPQPLSA